MTEENEPEEDKLIPLLRVFGSRITDLVSEIEKLSPKKLQDLIGDKYEKSCDWLELINSQLLVAIKACKMGAVRMVLARLIKLIERKHHDADPR